MVFFVLFCFLKQGQKYPLGLKQRCISILIITIINIIIIACSHMLCLYDQMFCDLPCDKVTALDHKNNDNSNLCIYTASILTGAHHTLQLLTMYTTNTKHTSVIYVW